MKNSMSCGGVNRSATAIAPLARQSRVQEGLAMHAFGSENSRASARLPTSLPTSDQLQVGQVLDDRFKILDVINRGGMAWIYEALDRETGKSVVLKVPLLQYESDPGYFSRFQREENIGLTLDHPNIIKVMRAADKSRPYIAMEYLEGKTLAARLHEKVGLTEGEAARIVSQICEGLDYLHRKGVVHRDLKPENVMLCTDGAIRIMDFGIAKSENAQRMTI